MNIKLICVGQTSDNRIAILFDEYLKRIKYYHSLEVVYLVNKKKNQDERKLKELESISILESVKDGSVLILLDEKGQEFNSVTFSNFLQKRFNTGAREIVFVIGGAYGFSEKVYKRANFKVALSKMTFTHQMVRLIFIEQLYRAFTILRGEKYHH